MELKSFSNGTLRWLYYVHSSKHIIGVQVILVRVKYLIIKKLILTNILYILFLKMYKYKPLI